MSNDEANQSEPNITCIETEGSVQYVNNNPEENGTQSELQQNIPQSPQVQQPPPNIDAQQSTLTQSNPEPEAPQSEPNKQTSQSEEDSQIVLIDGRYMTVTEFKQQLAKKQIDKTQQSVPIKHQFKYKAPPSKRKLANNEANNRYRNRGVNILNSPQPQQPKKKVLQYVAKHRSQLKPQPQQQQQQQPRTQSLISSPQVQNGHVQHNPTNS